MTDVTVIIPVYNDPNGLRKTLDSLVKQTYTKSKFEVLVVDNASTDSTNKVAKAYEREYSGLVTVTEETDIQGSYAARNTGIKKSNSKILAFIDADCRAHTDWIATGLKTLENSDADLVGGKIEFKRSDEPSATEVYDSAFSMQTKQLIAERNCTVTANLFCSRKVVGSIGTFSEEVVSGGDIAWTSKATANGFTLVYAEDAIVSHPTRDLFGLIQKKKRIGQGKSQKHSFKTQLIPMTLDFLPPNPFRVISQLQRADIPPVSRRHVICACIISWICKLSINSGRLSYYLHNTTYSWRR